MSRYVYFYALDSKQGREELYEDLTSTTKYAKSFADFIAERTVKCGSSLSVTYQQVITSVKNNFEDLQPSQLREIVNWYEDMFYRRYCKPPEYEWERYEKAVESALKGVGIEPLFEITSSSASCYGFIFQYRNFESVYEPDAFNEDGDNGSNIKRHEFIRFLNYMILLMCRIHDENLEHQFDYTELPENHQKEIESIKTAHRDDAKLQALVDKEFEWIKGYWIKDHENNKGPCPEAQTVNEHHRFLTACLDMKATLTEEYTRVLMVHG
ncbi:hypothetical protein [Mucilaginibacter sp. CSA2-8R]|uniref:hypothetical protein n=1 Tax=Mucilaginibacter sp. CSA2-8R TaxID=3141542 RepID=UPI00315D31B7